MSLANQLQTNKQLFTDANAEYLFTAVKANSIGSRVGLAPLIVEGVGLDGNGSAIVGGMAAVESASLFSNDASKVADMSAGVMDFTATPLINGVPITSLGDWNGDATSDLSMNGFDIKNAGDVDVSGVLTVDGLVYLNNDVEISGNLVVKGDVIKKDELDVCGNAQFYGNVWIEDDLDVCGNVRVVGDISAVGDVYCDTLHYQALDPAIQVDVSANMIYTDALPADISNVDYFLYQDANKVAKLLKENPLDLFPAVPAIADYVGTVYSAPDEATLSTLLTGAGSAVNGDIVEITADIALSAPITVAVNVELRGDTRARVLSCASDQTLIYNVGGLLKQLTIQNTSTSSIATAVVLNSAITAVPFEIKDCYFQSNEFSISSSCDRVNIQDCSFATIGTPDSQRHISLPYLKGLGFISNCDFEGNTLNSTQCVFMNSADATYYLGGKLCIYDCRCGSLANPVQRLYLCETDLTGGNFEMWLKGNETYATSGFAIFYSDYALLGVEKIGLYQNIENEVSPNIGKGLIGCDSAITPAQLGTPQLYASGNQPASLRADYSQYSIGTGLVAYKTSAFTPPAEQLPTLFDYYFATQGGGYAITDLEMNKQKITFDTTTSGISIVAAGQSVFQQGVNAIAIGDGAGSSSQTTLGIAIGYRAGATSQGNSAIAIGASAASNSQNDEAIAIGKSAGASQDFKAIAIGSRAGRNQSVDAINIGSVNSVDIGTQNEGAIAIGSAAVRNTQGQNAIAIGRNASVLSQSANSIILNATGASINASQQSLYVKPVRNAGGSDVVYYNSGTGEMTYDAPPASTWVGTATTDLDMGNFDIHFTNGKVRIGDNETAQSGQSNEAVAIGLAAGKLNQGSGAVAIGKRTAQSNQAADAIAIGTFAGQNTQASNAVAIGREAGYTGQKANAIAIGNLAGFNSQALNSIAISSIGANQNNTVAESIVLNADATAGAITVANKGLYVKPVRNATTSDVVYYDSATGEMTYDAPPASTWVGTATTDLDMDSNNITNATDITASGTISAADATLTALPAKTTETDVVYYDAGTGTLSYGAGGGGSSWVGTATSDLDMNDYKINFTDAKVRLGSNFTGQTNQGNQCIAIGDGAGNLNQKAGIEPSIAIGISAGAENQGGGTLGSFGAGLAIGNYAGRYNQIQEAIAIGREAGNLNQSGGSVALGAFAGQQAQGSRAVAIGHSAGKANQGANSIALSSINVEQNNTVAESIVINADATAGAITVANKGLYVKPVRNATTSDVVYYDSATGEMTYGAGGGGGSWVGTATSNLDMSTYKVLFTNGHIKMGTATTGGSSTSNGAVAIGNGAQSTSGIAAIAIGLNAGGSQSAGSCVAIGNGAGSNNQGASAVAIGAASGQGGQSANTVAVGRFAGGTQGAGAVAIGAGAGKTNQASNTIVISSLASSSTGVPPEQNNTVAESIVINADATVGPITVANKGLYVAPIRVVNSTAGLNQLYYDPTTKEIVYYQP